MLSLLASTWEERDYYLLIRVTILEQVLDFFTVYQTGSLDTSNLNIEKTCAVQQESTFDLCR